MKKPKGPAGKAHNRPRQPTPIPRTLPIVLTNHAIKRCDADRGIPREQLTETIVNGREITTLEKGTHGGWISRFQKSFISRETGAPVTRMVIAVCEVFPDKLTVLSAYYG